MKKESNNIQNIFTEHDEKIYNQIQKLLSKSKKVQRYIFHNDLIRKHYTMISIIDKEDAIHIVDKHYILHMHGDNLYIKATKKLSGITFKKKGRATERLKSWDFNIKKTLIDVLCTKLQIDKTLLEDEVIQNTATKGLISSILCGKIKTKTEAMEYYIKYNLRGYNINISKTEEIYAFLKYIGKHYSVMLRVAKDPNKFLDWILENRNDKSKLEKLHKNNHLTTICLALNEKIDWVSADFDSESKKLLQKGKKTKDLLNIWRGGLILRSEYQSVLSNSIDYLLF